MLARSLSRAEVMALSHGGQPNCGHFLSSDDSKCPQNEARCLPQPTMTPSSPDVRGDERLELAPPALAGTSDALPYALEIRREVAVAGRGGSGRGRGHPACPLRGLRLRRPLWHFRPDPGRRPRPRVPRDLRRRRRTRVGLPRNHFPFGASISACSAQCSTPLHPARGANA